MFEQPENIEDMMVPEHLSVNDMQVLGSANWVSPEVYRDYTGEKFLGGFGPTSIFDMDYPTLRARSSQLFTENLYARGLIRRLATNIINRGLSLEAVPDESVLGLPEDSLSGWSEMVENRFAIYADNPDICDFYGVQRFGELQKSVWVEAAVEGDVLCILYTDGDTGLPKLRIVPGSQVVCPIATDVTQSGNTIEHGVELDINRRQVAYWVATDDGGTERIPAFGPNSGRRVAWLYYATDKRVDGVRGEPLLGLILQSIKEIDRYRDSAQRKATVNSLLAMFIKKTKPKMSSLPVTGTTRKQGTVDGVNADGSANTRKLGTMGPGTVIEVLQEGEEPFVHSTQGTDANFPAFEAAVLSAIAWANEVPPEILRLTYGHNYSASQAAVNEFNLFLDPTRERHSNQLCKIVYIEYLTAEVLAGRVPAPGFIASRGNRAQFDIYGAWVASDWVGAIKPSVDMLKQGKAFGEMVDRGWVTNQRATRTLTGMRSTKVVKQLKKENQALAAALAPLQPAATQPTAPTDSAAQIGALSAKLDEVIEAIGEMQGVQ